MPCPHMTQTGSQADKIAVMHNTAQSTRVTYAVVIVKVGKVGAEMQGVSRGETGNNPETLSRTCP